MLLQNKMFLATITLGLSLLVVGLIFSSTYAQEGSVPKTLDLGAAGIGAGIAIGGAGLGAGIGLGIAVSSIVAAGAERPEIIGRFFIFIVFIEAIAIYGLIISIFLITFLPASV
ncbi:MAG: ATP synthase subunit C [Candidatus Bathyarchaeia archaeon]